MKQEEQPLLDSEKQSQEDQNLEGKLEDIVGDIKNKKEKYSSGIIEKIKNSTIAKLKWPLTFVTGVMILGTITLYYSPAPNKSQNQITNNNTIDEVIEKPVKNKNNNSYNKGDFNEAVNHNNHSVDLNPNNKLNNPSQMPLINLYEGNYETKIEYQKLNERIIKSIDEGRYTYKLKKDIDSLNILLEKREDILDKLERKKNYTADGNKYVGKYKDGKIHGQGTETYANGDKYAGEWENSYRHGQGTYTWVSGDKYVGEWEDGKKHGQGTFTHANGNKYVGKYKDGKKHGQGTYTWVLGDIYVGGWGDGKFHGQGTYTWADGISWTGEWKEGKKFKESKKGFK